jgi:phage repressor protein C with HTH and peptisase S24 domain
MLENTDLQTNKIGLRLKEVRSVKDMTLEQFYGPVTEHVSNCSAIENNKRNIGKRLSKDIIAHHRINSEWLKTGDGEMFEDNFADRDISFASSTDPGVPFFNVNLSDLLFDGLGMLKEPPEYYVNYRPFNDCDAYLPIYGDSMYPRYSSGEVIAVREIKNFNVIQWGEAYLVVADERANHITTVKLLFEHQDEKKIVLRSSNPNFIGDTIIDRDMIKRLFIVKGKVTRHQL